MASKEWPAGRLRERVAFDVPTVTTGALGGEAKAWSEAHECPAEWVYKSGGEAVQAARLAGRSIFKVRVRATSATRALTTEHRMRDKRRGLPSGVSGDTLPGNRWNIREVDAISDPRSVYLMVEGEVAS